MSALSSLVTLLLLQVNPHVCHFSGIRAHGEAGKPVRRTTGTGSVTPSALFFPWHLKSILDVLQQA